MRWTKLKQRVESMFADEVRGRVELWTTRYEKADDRGGRSWITIDGQEIVNMTRFPGGREGWGSDDLKRLQAGGWTGYDLPDAMRSYLSLSINDALASANPLIRALAMLDRRAGKRRLARLDPEEEVPLVRELLLFRRSIADTGRQSA